MTSPEYSLVLHVFRRDLRLDDNTALIHALKSSKSILPCFIFDPRQVDKNTFKSKPGLQFMLNSLDDLDGQLKLHGGRLYYFYGRSDEVIAQLIDQLNVGAVFVNKDYTPFSVRRDLVVKKVCTQKGVSFNSFDDALLHAPGEILKDSGGPYTVYTPFYKKSQTMDVNKPISNKYDNFYTEKVSFENRVIKNKLLEDQVNLFLKGGSSEAESILKNIAKLTNYDQARDIPSVKGTTGLSAHHKFGTISVRKVYHHATNVLGEGHTFIKELYWRDFFTHIAHHFPYVFGQPFYDVYENLKWDDDKNKFKKWCEGKTGFPIVDAGMRELNTTGFMHNRVRMITASFLIKDLHINWQWGEKYFAQSLIDYDPAVNNGNWQWAASTGCDATPYFRIFNPWLQQKKFDPDCVYIKKWIPELSALSGKEIHDWEKNDQGLLGVDYPLAMVNHKEQAQETKQRYKDVRNG